MLDVSQWNSLVPDPLTPSCPVPYSTTTSERVWDHSFTVYALDDQISLYVTNPQATNTISIIVILMCHTECLPTVLTFHSCSNCFLSVLVSCPSASSTYLPTSLGERISSSSLGERKLYSQHCVRAARLQMLPNRTRAPLSYIVLVA